MALNRELSAWRRLLNGPWHELSPEAARGVLAIQIETKDQRRVSRLLDLGNRGMLTDGQLRELDGYLYAGKLLGLIHSRARRALKTKGVGQTQRKAS